MINETKNLYTVTPNLKDAGNNTPLKKIEVLIETDEGKLVTLDEFRGEKPKEEEPAEAVVEQESYKPALYPLFNKKHIFKEPQEYLGKERLIVRFTNEVSKEEKKQA